MKNYYLFFIIFFSVQFVQAQCVLNGSDNNLTQAEIESCLNSSSCSSGTSGCSVTLSGGTFSIKSAIDLSANYPGLTFTIASDAEMKFFDQGGNSG